ncbi:hypothetical protein R6Q59_014714 [Mikania micrantha]
MQARPVYVTAIDLAFNIMGSCNEHLTPLYKARESKNMKSEEESGGGRRKKYYHKAEPNSEN